MIEIRDVSLVLSKRQILKDISLTLRDGRIYGLVGNNGSGKTMLMKCICGFVKPDCGEIVSDGVRIGKDADYLPDAGVIIETPGFISHYSGFQNLRALAGIKRKIDDRKIRDTLQLVGLDASLRLPVRKYSLGMRQRLGLAQALMEDPQVLILDEPMNGLDRQGVGDVRELLLSLKNKGRLILLASHNAEDVHVLCDEIYEMEQGEVVR